MTTKLFYKTFMSSAFALMLLFTAAPASFAQQAETASATIEEILVTSRRREESLQAVPESITAFSAAQIERAGITNFRDVADLTPNLSQLENFRPGLARIQIRGLITPQVGDPPVAFVVDGITASDLEFINQELFDVERIEVLRGAQGALYGRGAIGGAINIVTKQPTNETEGSVTAAFANGDEYRLSGVASGALSPDKVHYRVGAYTRDYGGLIDNTFLNEKVDFHEETSVFGKLVFTLSDISSMDFRARHTSTDAGIGYYQNVSDTSFENFSNGVEHNVPGLDQRDVVELTGKYDYDFANSKLELIAGYSNSDQKGFSDADYSSVESDFIFHFAGAQENILEVESKTAEARLTSTTDGRLRWALGSFLQSRTRDSVFNYYDDFVGNMRQDRSDFDQSQIFFSILDENTSDAWALSGQINYDLTDKLELTTALRYDVDKRESFDSRDRATTFASDTFKELQPKVSLSYQSNENLLFYTGYSSGFRSGGFNEYSPVIQRVFDKELSDSFEAGFKSTLNGGAMTINGAVFRIDQKDAQITRFNLDSFTLENISVDDATSQGFEIELAAKPTDKLTIGLSGGVIDSEINAFAERPDLIGYSLPYVSKNNFNASIEYDTPISSAYNLILRTDVQNVGPRIFSFDVPDVESSSHTFVNARASLESDVWSFTLYSDNLTDERQVEDLFLFGDGVVDLARFPNQEARYGFEAKYRF